MTTLDWLLHYAVGFALAFLCLRIIRAIARAWLDRNQLREQRQMGENIQAMREWHAIQAPVRQCLDQWYRGGAERIQQATKERDEAMAAWRQRWGVMR